MTDTVAEWAWQAAAAEANKRINALESELTDTRNAYHASRTEFYAMQANNHDFREALEEPNPEIRQAKIIEALSETPAESLQAHDDEVIEKCAKVCDEWIGQEPLAEAIRALKGKV